MSTSSTDNPASTIRKYPIEKIEQAPLPNLKTGIDFGVLLDHAKFICIQSPVLAARHRGPATTILHSKPNKHK